LVYNPAHGGSAHEAFPSIFRVIPCRSRERTGTRSNCAQYQADVAVWGDSSLEIEYNQAQTAFTKDGTRNKTDIAKLGWDEVVARQNEMITCMKVDRQKSNTYYDVMGFYHSVLADRLFNFVSRHNLWTQVKLEDSQGKR
jgi:hypothetical protein